MGIVLDSTALIAAERAGKNPRGVIEEIAEALGDTEAALSVVTIIELAHGIERANTNERRTTRDRFLHELLAEITPEPVTVPIAFRAGKLDGSLQAVGTRIALGDLLIGATALELGYAVATHNVRHFQMIPPCGEAALEDNRRASHSGSSHSRSRHCLERRRALKLLLPRRTALAPGCCVARVASKRKPTEYDCCGTSLLRTRDKIGGATREVLRRFGLHRPRANNDLNERHELTAVGVDHCQYIDDDCGGQS